MGLILLVFMLVLSPPVLAAESCRVPEVVREAACPHDPEPVGTAGAFDYYILALSWSDQFCATARANGRNAHQCRDNDFDLIVHGLWPQYDRRQAGQGWPQFCAPASPVPSAEVRRTLCTVPGEQLIQCEWAKHGTCADWPEPEGYFDRTRSLFQALRQPDLSGEMSVGRIAAAFRAVNPAVPPEALRVLASPDGRAFRELRICYTRQLDGFRPCSATAGGLDPTRPDQADRRLSIRRIG